MIPPCEFPPELEYVWNAYLELATTRRERDPVQFQEIVAWCALMRTPLRPREVRLITRLDMAYQKATHED